MLAGLQVLEEGFNQAVAVRDQPDVEIEEKRRGRIIAERRKLGERPAGDHLLQLQQLGGAMRLIEDFDRGIEADAFLPAHQGLVAEDRARPCFDNWLESIFDDEFREGHDLIAGITAQ